jgi:hypothetical protein
MMHQGTQAVKAVNRQFWNRSKGAAVLPAACSEEELMRSLISNVDDYKRNSK